MMEALGKFFEAFGKHLSARVLLSIATSAFTLYWFDLLPGYLSGNLKAYALAVSVGLVIGVSSYYLFKLVLFLLSPMFLQMKLRRLSFDELAHLYSFANSGNRQQRVHIPTGLHHLETLEIKNFILFIESTENPKYVRAILSDDVFLLLREMPKETFQKKFNFNPDRRPDAS